ncbi:MAG: thioredoxin family protein [Crocinitomicaceae bacterium]
MRKLILIISVLVAVSCGTQKVVDTAVETTANKEKTALSSDTKDEISVENLEIEWLDFETAIERNKKKPKYIFIDVYTDWCGWCKKMDVSTFVAPEVVKYMNKHFYSVKMDAEMREAIAYNEKLYEFKQYTPRAGYNTLAFSLLGGKMSFPSFVILDKREAKRGTIMGYKTESVFLTELQKYVK